jgi:hypothetical protein
MVNMVFVRFSDSKPEKKAHLMQIQLLAVPYKDIAQLSLSETYVPIVRAAKHRYSRESAEF